MCLADVSLAAWCLGGVLLLRMLGLCCGRAESLSIIDLIRSTCGLRSGDPSPVLVDVLPPTAEPLEVPTRMEFHISLKKFAIIMFTNHDSEEVPTRIEFHTS